MDVAALAAGDAVQVEDVGPVADFRHRRPAQVVAQLGVAGQDHRQPAADVLHDFHQALVADERVAVQVVRLVDEQRDGPIPFFHQFL